MPHFSSNVPTSHIQKCIKTQAHLVLILWCGRFFFLPLWNIQLSLACEVLQTDMCKLSSTAPYFHLQRSCYCSHEDENPHWLPTCQRSQAGGNTTRNLLWAFAVVDVACGVIILKASQSPKHCTVFYNAMRLDFTTLWSCHSIFISSSILTIVRLTVEFRSHYKLIYQECAIARIWLANAVFAGSMLRQNLRQVQLFRWMICSTMKWNKKAALFFTQCFWYNILETGVVSETTLFSLVLEQFFPLPPGVITSVGLWV